MLPKLWYWKRASWTRSQWFCYSIMKPYLKYKDNGEYRAIKVGPEKNLGKVIWVYWRQGEENAPGIVRKCIRSIRENSSGYRVIVLDGNKLSDYLTMPDFIEKKHKEGKIKEALYSDLLRISLLLEYGGVWCDATCFMTSNIPSIVEDVPFFMFNMCLLFPNTIPSECSSWFIKADKGNVTLRKLRNVLFHYYRKHGWTPNYYLFHITLGLLIHTDEEVHKEWEDKPYICNMNPHVFLFSFRRQYCEQIYKHILNSCFIHKLTYKYDPQLLEEKKENMLRHFMND